MKTFNLILIITLFTGSSLFAQKNYDAKNISVEEINRNMSRGEQTGFQVKIYQATKKEVENGWAKTVRQSTKSKVENINSEHVIAETNIKTISTSPLNVYAIINEHTDHIELFTFFEQDSIFITKEKNETVFLAAKKFTRDFAVGAYRDAVANEMKEEEKKLSDLEGEFKKIVNENDKLHKNINNDKLGIEKTKGNIATNKLDQERARNNVQSNKDELAKLKQDNAIEAAVKEGEKKVKDAESELTKLQKNEEGMHKDVNKMEASIRDNERKIASNEQALELKQNEIGKQKEILNLLKKKIESIK